MIDDFAKGGLTQFGELFTVIPCARKDFTRCLKAFAFQIETEGSLEIKKLSYDFWFKTLTEKLGPQRIMEKSSEVG